MGIDRNKCLSITERLRAVLGMFDVSARPCVSPDVLTFAVPWPKFVRMVETMDESFLITDSWHRVRSRIQQGKERTGNAS
jgi:hypothetical protein